MIIRTESYRDLEEDIAIICDCFEGVIYQKVGDFHNQCTNGLNFDWDKFYELVEQFVKENADISLVDEVYVYHLARHFSEPTELLPLEELLFTRNSFSDFLADNDIVFKNQDGQAEFYYKGHLIDLQQLLTDGHQRLLARRLGYLGEADFCINGFPFWPDIEETSDGYYRDLQFGPEVIGCIGRYLGINLCQKYRELTNYYGIVFKIPVGEIILDGKDNIKTREDKMRYLLKCSLQTLHGCYFQCPSNINNPIIRIRDDLKVKVEHCILIDEE